MMFFKSSEKLWVFIMDRRANLRPLVSLLAVFRGPQSSADLEVQLVQLNHCDGVLVITLKHLIRAINISTYINLYV